MGIRTKKIITIMTVINEIKNRQTVKKINEVKNSFFKKINMKTNVTMKNKCKLEKKRSTRLTKF